MAYSSITFLDKNPIKRFLQNKRLSVALSVMDKDDKNPSICDFGSGNGELLKRVNLASSRLTCYEPSPELIAEAKENLTSMTNVDFTQHVDSIPELSQDYVFCLEVFEHLPEKETIDALKNISRILKKNGTLIIGVPVEIGAPAIYKGLFRLTRRRKTFDTSLRNIISASLFSPPKIRPKGEIAEGFNFHFEHMGFDHRKLKSTLADHFNIKRVFYSPFNAVSLLMPEIYFEVEKKGL
ncbi:class I SAM-dependent methyltransferase [Cedecea davisae]|uniref:class I SAM-dependent methyltransferase n=1 Tax=Cedecea davisae TaxID=158484 RepID=UPI001D0B93D7|nr:class I SAM-dependent methyltransferase [Cedecea davisae]